LSYASIQLEFTLRRRHSHAAETGTCSLLSLEKYNTLRSRFQRRGNAPNQPHPLLSSTREHAGNIPPECKTCRSRN